MLVTNDWLKKNMTSSGAYTKKQMEVLGLEFPCKKGWKQQVIGMKISEHQKRMFEIGAHIKPNCPVHKVINKYSRLSELEKEYFDEWYTKAGNKRE